MTAISAIKVNNPLFHAGIASIKATCSKPVQFGLTSDAEAEPATVHAAVSGNSDDGNVDTAAGVPRAKRFDKAGYHLKKFLLYTGTALAGALVSFASQAIKNKTISTAVAVAGSVVALGSVIMVNVHKYAGLYQGARGLMAKGE